MSAFFCFSTKEIIFLELKFMRSVGKLIIEKQRYHRRTTHQNREVILNRCQNALKGSSISIGHTSASSATNAL